VSLLVDTGEIIEGKELTEGGINWGINYFTWAQEALLLYCFMGYGTNTSKYKVLNNE
jgi:hypothetical protein